MGGASAGDVALFAGGKVSIGASFVATDRVDLYDVSSQTWSQATLSVPRMTIAATSVGDLAIFAGGALTGGNASDAVDIYDASTGTWSTAQLSHPRTGVSAATVGSFAIFAGGAETEFGSAPSDVIDIFDAATGAWSTAVLPAPLPWVQGVSAGDRAVFLSDDGVSPLVSFDPITGSSMLIPRPAQLGSDVIVALGSTPGRLWIAGGGQTMLPMSMKLFEYDIAQGVWSVGALSEARGGLRISATSTKLVAAGGLASSVGLVASDVVDLIDLVDGSLTSATLEIARAIPEAVEVEGRVLLAGGLAEQGGTLVPSDAVDIFDDNVGTLFCSPAVPNSTGAPATIRLEGTPGTLALGHVGLVASDLPKGSSGYFLASLTQALVPGAGGSQGTLCLGGTVGRYAITPFFTGFDGESTQTVDLASIPNPTSPTAALPGQTWSFQAWYRDANPGATTNFTPGVSLLIQ